MIVRVNRRSAALRTGAVALLVLLAAAASAAARLRLPASRATATNVYTLVAFEQASASTRAANFELRICATSKAPISNLVETELFSITLAGGATVAHTGAGPKQPALDVVGLPAGHCVEGWLTWKLPGRQHVKALTYSLGSRTLTWRVG